MKPFNARAADVTRQSAIAVQVLLSHDNNDMEFLLLRPVPVHLSARFSEEEFTARQLRFVGIVGLSGLNAKCAFEEPLDERVVSTIASAFIEYTRALLTQSSFGDYLAQAEVTELERLYALPDTRQYPPSSYLA